MPTCLLCKKDVASGYVVCGDCAGDLKTGAMPPVLGGFAAWLGAELAGQDTVYFCSVCETRKCDDDATCRKGITAWFRESAEKYWEACNSGILGRLKTVCLFPEVFEDLEPAGSPYGEVGGADENLDQTEVEVSACIAMKNGKKQWNYISSMGIGQRQ